MKEMRQADFERIARDKPFRPFEVQLVDGRKYQFKSPEEFVVGKSVILTIDKKGLPLLINLGLVSTVQRLNGNGR